MKFILLCMTLLCVVTIALSQKSFTKIRTLTIGDTVPDIEFHNILNYHSKSARLSDFKGKLLILDFWNTWCGACIASFPKMNLLQDSNQNKIQILLITKNTAHQVKKLFDRLISNGTSISTLPSITEDSTLSGMFPYNMVPHYVVINKDRIIQAITEGSNITQINIDKLIEEPIALPLKKDDLKYDFNRPLLVGNNGATDGDFLWRSVFTGYLAGLPSVIGIQADSIKSTKRIFATNISIRQMYEMALRKKFPGNRIFFDPANYAQDPFKMRALKDEQLRELYCYELIKPLSDTADMHKLMLSDLHRYSHIKGEIQYRKIKCWALQGSDSLIISSSNSTYKNVYDRNKKTYLLSKGKISNLVGLLDYYCDKPVFDETGISNNIDLKLNINLSDSRNVQRVLLEYGLKLVEIQKEVEILILSDKG